MLKLAKATRSWIERQGEEGAKRSTALGSAAPTRKHLKTALHNGAVSGAQVLTRTSKRACREEEGQ